MSNSRQAESSHSAPPSCPESYEPGPLRKTVAIELASGKQITAELTAEVVREVNWFPDELVLQPDALSNQPDRQHWTIENHSPDPVELKLRPNDGAPISVEIPDPLIPPGGTVPVIVRVPPNSIQHQRILISVETSHPRERHLELLAEIRPERALNPLPRAIHLGVISRAELLRRGRLSVRLRGPLLTHLALKAIATPPWLKQSSPPDRVESTGDSRTFEFTILDSFPGIDLSGSIRFSLRHPNSERLFQVEVPVNGFLMDSNSDDS